MGNRVARAPTCGALVAALQETLAAVRHQNHAGNCKYGVRYGANAEHDGADSTLIEDASTLLCGNRRSNHGRCRK